MPAVRREQLEVREPKVRRDQDHEQPQFVRHQGRSDREHSQGRHENSALPRVLLEGVPRGSERLVYHFEVSEYQRALAGLCAGPWLHGRDTADLHG